ncbi:XrtA/PEP-CTERM system histidine kinase PrsK [Thermaurantiacus sp.]
MLGGIGIASHALAAVAFLLLALHLVRKREGQRLALWVAGAALLTAIWAAVHALALLTGRPLAPWLSILGTARTAAWLAVLIAMVQGPLGLPRRPGSVLLLAAGLGFVITFKTTIEILFGLSDLTLAEPSGTGIVLLHGATKLVLSISGLVLLHNIYVSSLGREGPGIRFFAIAVGVLFAYDLNLYTLDFLLGAPEPALLDLRGAAFAMAIPLFYLAFRENRPERLIVSRAVAFNTISFSVIGLYLIFMSLFAYGLRLAGGNWGVLLQITFLTATSIIGMLLALSPRFRAELRVRISRNFYRYRYDYRTQWLGFLDKLNREHGPDGTSEPLAERIISATATVLECPGGALYEPDDAGRFQLVARWNWPTLQLASLGDDFTADALLEAVAADRAGILDFDSLRRRAGPDARACPAFAEEDPAIWLGVPLVHRGRLIALLLLERSAVVKDLNWEDHDLLRTLGQQSASYLAEAASQKALDEARSFDEYNRRFAFVMHDLKNVVSQLALVSRNAKRHLDNPAFREDLVATLEASVAKMTDLLALLGKRASERTPAPAVDTPVDLAATASLVAATLRRQHPAIDLKLGPGPLLVAGDPGRLEAMLTHLVQNAVDASAPDSPVSVEVGRRGKAVRIEVRDQGHGMSAAFIRDELFRPFRSSKPDGFGIGAYEAREIVRAHGGTLEVASRPGRGTRFTITLPAAEARAELMSAA